MIIINYFKELPETYPKVYYQQDKLCQNPYKKWQKQLVRADDEGLRTGNAISEYSA